MGWIVLWNGSYPCGALPDLNIAKDWLIDHQLVDHLMLHSGIGHQLVHVPVLLMQWNEVLPPPPPPPPPLPPIIVSSISNHHVIVARVPSLWFWSLVQMKIENGELVPFQQVVDIESFTDLKEI